MLLNKQTISEVFFINSIYHAEINFTRVSFGSRSGVSRGSESQSQRELNTEIESLVKTDAFE